MPIRSGGKVDVWVDGKKVDPRTHEPLPEPKAKPEKESEVEPEPEAETKTE